jgi:hypothetical protein
MVGGQPRRLLHRSARAGRHAGNAALLPRTPDHDHRRGDRVRIRFFGARVRLAAVHRNAAMSAVGTIQGKHYRRTRRLSRTGTRALWSFKAAPWSRLCRSRSWPIFRRIGLRAGRRYSRCCETSTRRPISADRALILDGSRGGFGDQGVVGLLPEETVRPARRLAQPASRNGSLLGSKRDRKIAASIGSSKQ